ncbi:MAG TPA: tRNA dihydrouridine synthase DusB [Bacteroidales bacterium]|jgi:nifR3 family TIM-barrel protein|nr:tRNA dihydrouridine synthase DusB [Bacteroidales bacterium]HRR48831.1 tRNA dihydrouridine synthase DusB [Bacteroidales bacterium]HRT33408.1 tRNA dihydrouridine synthase DusB [Bacteroidales bacterium]
MKIAELDLDDKPLFLAPMEGVTDTSFRYICKKFGVDMMYTEFVSSDGLIRDAKSSVAKLEIFEYERPIGIQIYGHIPEAMVEAARLAEEATPSLIDINFGCPVNKIANRGAGSGMMRFPDKMVEITRQIVDAVKIPVTVKTRLGWDENSKIIVQLAERLQDVGIAALTIHGRTRTQLYKGEADWRLIGEVKNNPRMFIPVIGNGDISSPEDAKEAFDKFGVDGVMIGRATFGRPWIFKEIKYYLSTGEKMEELSLEEKKELAINHLKKSIEVKGERKGVLEMRRHLAAYFKTIPHFRETRRRLVTEDNPDELIKIITNIE